MDEATCFSMLRETMERCSEIVSEAYVAKAEHLQEFRGELPPGHNAGHRRQKYWVTELGGDLVVALPGTTHPLDWSSNLRVQYTPIDGSQPAPGATTEQLEQVPCAHAGFFFRAETVPTLALLEQAAAKGCRLVLTGHSLGGAVANLCALTALSAQKKARNAAARSSAARRRAGHAKAKAAALRSPFAAAARAALLPHDAAHNHSYCSANSDVLVSPEAALVDVLCISFASPVYANAALVQHIEDNDWSESFVNIVVPEDYCLKLFNNVLTSAPPSESSLSRTSSCSSSSRSSRGRASAGDLDPFDQEVPDAEDDAAAAAAEQPLRVVQCLVACEGDGGGNGSTAPRFTYQPASQQPLVSALAGTRRKQKKQQLSFAHPVHRHLDDEPGGGGSGSCDSLEAVACAAAAEAQPAARPLPEQPACVDVAPGAPEQLAGLGAAPPCGAAGPWNELPAVLLPLSPSTASISSLSEGSLSSTRSWTLLAYLPDMLSRSLSGSLGSWSSSRSGSTDAGAAPAPAAVAAAAPDAAAAAGDAGDAGWAAGLRHAKSSADLGARGRLGSLSPSESGSSDSLCSLDDLSAERVLSGMHDAQPLGGGPGLLDGSQRQTLQQLHQLQLRRSGGLRRSMSSASLGLRRARLLAPLASAARLSGSLGLVSSLLPSMRRVLLAGRSVLSAASSVRERVFNIPLDVLEAGLIKALRPPMYQPVGQQWILSATGLVPQQQPIHSYPRHVHDVFWHKDLALVAFREHSILFYKRRLLQQASRR